MPQDYKSSGAGGDILGGYYGKKISQIHIDNIGDSFSSKESGNYILKNTVDNNNQTGALKGGSSDGKRGIPEAKELELLPLPK